MSTFTLIAGSAIVLFVLVVLAHIANVPSEDSNK